jgi:soluble lytic murein transglycosylase
MRTSTLSLTIVALGTGLVACQPPESPEGPPDRIVGVRPPSAAVNFPLPPELFSAGQALDRGLAWRATLELAPILADHTARSDEAILLAARAADAWGGASEVMALLTGHEFDNGDLRAEARRLLVRAELEEGEPERALLLAQVSVRDAAPGSRQYATALVQQGLAYQSLGDDRSAADAFERAAPEWGGSGDWLLLRAATVTADDSARGLLLRQIVHPLARQRVKLINARALLRQADSTQAASAYLDAGWPAMASAISLRLAADSADTAAAKSALMEFIRDQPQHVEFSFAVQLITGLRPLPADEELLIARLCYARRLYSAAQASYKRALEGGLGTDRDRFNYGKSLASLRFFRPAARAFAAVDGSPTLVAQARYEEAMARLRGRLGGTRKRLQALERDFPQEPAAMEATLLLADLASDARNERDARRILLAGVARAPQVRLAALARYRAALIAIGFDEVTAAAAELDTLVLLHPDDRILPAALYWSGRAWFRLGDEDAAQARWRVSLRRDATGYYAGLSRSRLNISAPSIPAGTVVTSRASIDSAIGRMEVLRELGLYAEARLEEADLIQQARDTSDRLVETAVAFRRHGEPAQALRLATRALALGAERDHTLLTLLYPVLRPDALLNLANERDVDPALIAGLIRQESNFDPSATSRAGARGLMQIMPGTGSNIARRERYPLWDPVLLYEPDVSLEMGTTHLANLINSYGHPNFVLAAYNAGGSRVRRWQRRAGVEDPELFVERIPYRETRNYVKIVQANREVYAGLYGW